MILSRDLTESLAAADHAGMAERRGAALQRLRSAHEAAVLGELRRSGALSRAELIERVGLSRTTLFTIVSDLLAREAVIEQPGSEPPGGRGRLLPRPSRSTRAGPS